MNWKWKAERQACKDGDDTYHHYRFGDWEQPDGSLDRAYYQEGDTVSIKADDPEDGMEFAGWKCDTDGVTIAESIECRDDISDGWP